MEPIIVFTPEFTALLIGIFYAWAAAYFPSLITVPFGWLSKGIDRLIDKLCTRKAERVERVRRAHQS